MADVECHVRDSSALERRLFGIDFVAESSAGAVGRVQVALRSPGSAVFAFGNMHTVNLARRSPAYAEALAACTVFNDGVAMDAASQFLTGARFPHNLNGTDLTPAILAALDRPTTVAIVGGKPGVAEQAAAALVRDYPNIRIVGLHDGYFDMTADDAIMAGLREQRPDLVLVGMGNPRQEFWAVKAARDTDAVYLCIGAFVDFAAGRVSRAPGWMRKARIEWLHRLAIEPRRLASRYLLGGPSFVAAIARERFAPARRPSPTVRES